MAPPGEDAPAVKRLGALATLVWDRIWRPGAVEPVEQWGGAVYSLSSLSASCPPGWTVVPMLKVGADLHPRALSLLGSLPHLDLGPGVRAVPERNNVVELRYLDAAERDEVQLGGVPGWRAKELAPVLAGLDALYVNFLSGCEMELETAERVRAAFPGPIYADLHSLFLSPADVGPRARRPLPDWERWVACFDVIQLNEVELGLLAGGAGGRERFPEALLELGPRAVLVTLGERGARFAARGPAVGCRREAAGAPLRVGCVPPPEGALQGDPTGCGDVWGSACMTGLLAGLPLEAAIARAHRAAGAKILHPETAALRASLSDALR